ncbi:MAG TPA: alpha/beta fold hydrolase [Oculatellaceae cyanobacterium]
MKFKISIALLLVSLLANGVSILFLVLVINQSHHISQLKKQKNEIAHQLNIVQDSANSKMTPYLAPSRVSRQVFMSHLDNREDCFAVAPPDPSPVPGGVTLVVYLHGLGGSFLEPFIYGNPKPIGFSIIEHCPQAVVLSCSYRREKSFGNDEALFDITQNIRHMCQRLPVKKIILFGESMGGMTVLNYGATAPSDIQEKLTGIVSIEGAGDLAQLFVQTIPGIRVALSNAFGTPTEHPALYQRKSFNYNVHRLPPRVKVAIISAIKDIVVPPIQQQEIIAALKSNNNPCCLIPFDSGHGFPPESMSLQAFDFANR